MHLSNTLSARVSPRGDKPIALVLRLAKRLHRAAASDSLSTALPVLRRLLAAGVMPQRALPESFRCRGEVQRKHLLRMLAIEAGFSGWKAYRPALAAITTKQLPHLELIQPGYGNFNVWFSNESQACAFVLQHGGRALCVGSQAVVVRNYGPTARGEAP